MKALLLYALYVVVGGVLAYFIGRFVEYEFGETTSLMAFLFLFFLNFAVCWLLVILTIDGNFKNAQGAVEQRALEKSYRSTQQNPGGGRHVI